MLRYGVRAVEGVVWVSQIRSVRTHASPEELYHDAPDGQRCTANGSAFVNPTLRTPSLRDGAKEMDPVAFYTPDLIAKQDMTRYLAQERREFASGEA